MAEHGVRVGGGGGGEGIYSLIEYLNYDLFCIYVWGWGGRREMDTSRI